MSISRLFHEFRPFFRMLEEPLTRGPPTLYGFPHRAFLADPLFTSPSTVHPALDLTEEGNSYVVEAELPGVKKENIDISVGEDGRSVTIQGRTISRQPGDSLQSTIETGTSQGEGTHIFCARLPWFVYDTCCRYRSRCECRDTVQPVDYRTPLLRNLIIHANRLAPSPSRQLKDHGQIDRWSPHIEGSKNGGSGEYQDKC